MWRDQWVFVWDDAATIAAPVLGLATGIGAGKRQIKQLKKLNELGIDAYKQQREIDQANQMEMTDAQLFEVLGNMLGELRDGHVNMYSSFDVARNWSWHENYPSNISDSLITKYLGTDYKIANGMKYRVLDDNIGYIRCSTFENKLGSGNLDEIMSDLLLTRGLIIDLLIS